MVQNVVQGKKDHRVYGGSVNNLLGRRKSDHSHLYIAQGQRAFRGQALRMKWDPKARGMAMDKLKVGQSGKSCYISDVIPCKFAATEFLPSWNIHLPRKGQGFRLFMRLIGQNSSKPSGWLMIGEGGEPVADAKASTSASGWGATRIDYLDLIKPAVAFQYRVDIYAAGGTIETDFDRPVLYRFFVHYTGAGKRHAAESDSTYKPAQTAALDVPYRNQHAVEKVEIRNHICCPTSLAMVLEHYGIYRSTLDVCADVYDSRYDIYGVWPRASQAASQHGLVAWIQRFRSHEEVYQCLQSGRPIIASIRVEEGELRGASYQRSNGHIIVITGIRSNGKYIVNDPASPGPKGAAIQYFAEDMDKVWLDKGGVAILIKPDSNHD